MPDTLFQSDIKSLKLRHRGKVRDIYDIDDQHMLIVTTDRLSAFDGGLPAPIPGKGGRRGWGGGGGGAAPGGGRIAGRW